MNLSTKKIVSIVKNENKVPVYDLQTLKNNNFIVNETLVHNCILYQESLQLIYHKLAGVPLDETDMVRKAFTKKDIGNKEKMKAERDKLKEEFIIKCKEANDIDESVSRTIFEDLEKYVSYSFNKSLQEDTEIFVDGNLKKIKDIISGDLIETRNETTGENFKVKVKEKHDHGIQHVFKIKLDNGKEVVCTLDHKFRTVDGRMLPIKQIFDEGLDIVCH